MEHEMDKLCDEWINVPLVLRFFTVTGIGVGIGICVAVVTQRYDLSWVEQSLTLATAYGIARL